MEVNTPIRPNLPSIPEKMDEKTVLDWMVNISDAFTELAEQVHKDILAIIEAAGL